MVIYSNKHIASLVQCWLATLVFFFFFSFSLSLSLSLCLHVYLSHQKSTYWKATNHISQWRSLQAPPLDFLCSNRNFHHWKTWPPINWPSPHRSSYCKADRHWLAFWYELMPALQVNTFLRWVCLKMGRTVYRQRIILMGKIMINQWILDDLGYPLFRQAQMPSDQKAYCNHDSELRQHVCWPDDLTRHGN